MKKNTGNKKTKEEKENKEWAKSTLREMVSFIVTKMKGIEGGEDKASEALDLEEYLQEKFLNV